MTLTARFWAKVHTNPETGCWEWIAARNNKGYGVVCISKRLHLVHRVAWQAYHGPIADGLTVDHLCGTKVCVNPEHMEIVTRSVNGQRGRPRRPLFTDASTPIYQRPAVALEVRESGRCRHGHDITQPGAVSVTARGDRNCLACRREAWHRSAATRKSA